MWPKISIAVASDLITEVRPAEGKQRSRAHLVRQRAVEAHRVASGRGEAQLSATSRGFLEQTVNYRVPLEKVADLLKYDGSLVIDRTRGELSVHCDNEQANTLTLNIANDIVTGDRNVEQALAYHAQVIRGVQIGEHETYPYKLRFKVPQAVADTADPSQEAELLKHLGE